MDPRLTLKDAYMLFILECQSRHLSSHTLRFYNGRFTLILRWCDEQSVIYLDELTHHHIRQYLVDVQKRNVSSIYLFDFAKALKAFLNYCVRDELIEVSPMKKVKMPKVEKKILSAIALEDINKILKACTYERDKAICLFLLDSGLRARELLALNVANLNFVSGAVTVELGKGQKGRITYIGPKTRKQLLKYFIKERGGTPADRQPVFVTQNDNATRLDYEGLKQLFRRLKEETEIQFSAHSFRRTFAINSLRNGMNIYVLARLMGHVDITVLRVYLAITEVDLQAAHQQFGVVDNL